MVVVAVVVESKVYISQREPRAAFIVVVMSSIVVTVVPILTVGIA